MFYFVVEMNEDKLKEKYDIQDVYECIDAAYAQLQGRLAFTEGRVRYYTRDLEDGNDFQRLWRVTLALRDKAWFFDNVIKWHFVQADNEGNVSYAEDVLNEFKKL